MLGAEARGKEWEYSEGETGERKLECGLRWQEGGGCLSERAQEQLKDNKVDTRVGWILPSADLQAKRWGKPG